MRTSPLVAGALATITSLTLAALPAGAGETQDPATAATYAGTWIAGQVAPDGSVALGFSGPVGNAIDAALGLAVTGVGDNAFDRAVAFAEANIDDHLDPEGDGAANDNPGRLGGAILLADVAGRDPRAFGGTDLIARLEATRQTSGADAGRYGAEANAFAQVVLQSLAIVGLRAADVSVPADATAWLVDQQCDSGGFPAYRQPELRTTDDCAATATVAGNEVGPTPPDSNSTALAVQALVATSTARQYDTLDWLAGIQRDDGGFPFQADTDFATDASSTALVIQAITASGEDATAGRWRQPDGDTPLAVLTAFQVGCDGTGGLRGSIGYSSAADGNPFSTYQAVWGLAQAPLPLDPATLSASEPFPDCPLTADRRSGSERIATSIEIARAGFAAGSDTVVIAYAFGYADALTGAPLAAALGGPVLLSQTPGLTNELVAAVTDLGATKAVVLGGERVLSRQVELDLLRDTGVTEVERIGGADRFATASLVADRLEQATGEKATDVYVTEGVDVNPGRGWPDALAVSGLAAFRGQPILLVDTDSVPQATSDALAKRSDADATIVGGPTAVSNGVAASVTAEVASATRVSGADRYATAAKVADLALAAGANPETSWFATGRNFADALAAGASVGANGEVLVLVDGQAFDGTGPTADYVLRADFAIGTIRVVGGTGVVTSGVADALATLARRDAVR